MARKLHNFTEGTFALNEFEYEGHITKVIHIERNSGICDEDTPYCPERKQ